MINETDLSKLMPGERAQIVNIDKKSSMKRRLEDLGFCEESPVECLMTSPLGDPKAFWIKNTIIALREEDSRFVYVKKIK